MKYDNIIAAIDIGSAKIVAVLANISDSGEIDIIAFSEVPSKGVKKGGVVNIGLVQHAVDYALDELEANGNYQIHSIVCSLSGINIIGHNADGGIDIRGNSINAQNVKQVIASARDMSLAEGRQLLHILPQGFVVDNQAGIDNPIGLMGEKLEVRVHVVSAARTSYQNLHHAFAHRDIDLEYVVSANVASATQVANEDERALGVCVLDIGAGTTEITIYNNGAIQHSEVIPLGGELITSDVAFYMRSTEENAERAKRLIDLTATYTGNDIIEMPSVRDLVNRTFMKYEVANVIRERCEQLVEIVMQKLGRSGFEDSFPAGFVLCGGSANLLGLDSVIMEKSQLPVRIAQVEINYRDTLKDPKYANIMGLLLCAHSKDYTRAVTDEEKAGIIGGLRAGLTKFRKRLTDNF